MDFAVLANHRMKFKEREKKNNYVDLARELKKKTQKLWNKKVVVIVIVISALGTITKELVQGLEDLEIRERVETIQNTT